MDEYTFEEQSVVIPEKKWPAGRVILLILAILLTIQVIPMVGYVLNTFFILLVAILILGIVGLVFARKENRSIVGPVLAIAGAVVTLLRTFWFWMIVGANVDSALTMSMYDSELTSQITTWVMTGGIDWIIFIVATVFCYIAVFKQPKVTQEVSIDTQF